MHLGNETVMPALVLFVTFIVMSLIATNPPVPSNKRLSIILTCVLLALVVVTYQSIASRYDLISASVPLLFWATFLVNLTGRNQRNSNPEA